MTQQTAMQKLFINLESIDIKVPQGIKDIYLQVEKEQIIKAYNDGYRDGLPSTSKEGIDISEYDNARLYYKEIYD